jgi:hypothetical protein
MGHRPVVGTIIATYDAAKLGHALPDDLKPTMHVQYGSRILDVRDGLPKFSDMPKQIGGTGEMCDESITLK